MVGRRSGNHEARSGQNALGVCDLDRLVHFPREAEIVRRYHQVVQWCTSWRSFRKAKNSTASRSRRFIISGLKTISDTREAIFGALK